MATITKRRAASFRLPNYLLEGLKIEAKRQHRSVNNLVEFVLLNSLFHKPNAETLEAMAECKADVELEELTDENIDHLEEYIRSL
ncbi:MAG: toxin-antitoxin system protein [Prevotella sp.]|nr:toxin-antitoxin system protein [Prevotella sp.]